MDYSIAKIFHQKTKARYEKGAEKPIDFKSWPKEWTTTYFKSYPRLTKILLPKPKKLDFSLGKAITKRRSEREFDKKPIDLKDLSQLLFYSAGITLKDKDLNRTRRGYPSGGGRYPLEVYLFNLDNSKNLKGGIYHYNIREHFLESLMEKKNIRKEIYPQAVWQEEILTKAPMILVISGFLGRTMIKYKDRGYRYVLFEAGHLGQNIYLTSTALGLKCCAIGGFDDDKFHELLDIDGKNEVVLYVFALGH